MIQLSNTKKQKLPKNYPKGKWSEQALKVLKERYLLKNEKQEILETPEEMCYRVASAIASAEIKWGMKDKNLDKLISDYYNLMINRQFLPNSPTLMNAGKDNKLQYSACYVLPVEDSLSGIFDTIKNAALIHQSGGGTGFSFSRLRPRGAFVTSSGGKSTGPVGFMRVFDAATQEVKQGGTRRGANMGILRIDHPDILEFIDSKINGGITNFNISVGVTNKFMEALEKNKQSFSSNKEYELIDPHTKKVVGKLSAKMVMDKITSAAWRTGDPGMVFLDKINKSSANPVPEMGPIEATNPCGEQPLYPNEACNLGSLNLAQIIRNDKIDWDLFKKVVHLGVRFLDDVIEVNPYPLPEIDRVVKENRRIGLGVMGFADLLFKLKIPYDSKEALLLAEKVMKFITDEGHKESQELAKIRGPFPNFNKSIYKKDKPIRNSTVTTVAPTGTISIIADCSSGIEPIFALSFSHIVGERHLNFVNKIFEEEVKKRKIDSKLLDKVYEQGRIEDLEMPKDIKEVFKTSHEIEYLSHVKMQAAFQKYTDNAVSKTINLPNDATQDDIRKAYLEAYKMGCLGITVFRDGSKNEQVLNSGRVMAKPSVAKALDGKRERPVVALGATYKIETPLGTAYITVNQTGEGEPLEIFVNIGKAGSDVSAMAEALGRLIALIFRLEGNTPINERAKIVINELAGIGGSRSLGFGENKIRSLPDAIAKALSAHLSPRLEEHSVQMMMTKTLGARDICPKCGQAAYAYQEGCSKCYACGYSEC